MIFTSPDNEISATGRRTHAFPAPCARKAESVMPRSLKNVKNNEDGRAREKLQVVGVVVPLNAGSSSHTGSADVTVSVLGASQFRTIID